MPRSNRRNRKTRRQRGGLFEWLFGKKQPISSNTGSNLGPRLNAPFTNGTAEWIAGAPRPNVPLVNGTAGRVVGAPMGGRYRRSRRNNRRTQRHRR